MSDELWASLLALALLELEFEANKSNWQLMSRKTWNWMKKNSSNIDLDKCLTRAKECVKSIKNKQ